MSDAVTGLQERILALFGGKAVPVTSEFAVKLVKTHDVVAD
mgnify:CR=1 FL=1